MFVFLSTLLSSLTFRIRGGLRIPGTDKKFPLCKWWFAVFVTVMMYILRGFDIGSLITAFIAGKMCTSISGWGTYIGALLTGHISKDDKDDLNITDFVQNTLFKYFNSVYSWCESHKYFKWICKLIKFMEGSYEDHPRAYGFFTLSLRGGLTTYILGLAFNSPLFMFVGLLQGLVYYLGGLTCRHVYNDGKCGWKISEWYWGAVLGFFGSLWW